MGWNIDRFLAKDTIVSEFICSICTDVVECPVQTPCQHLFCNECIRRWINAGNRTCPEDRQALTVNALKPPSRLTLQFLNKLIIRCKNYNDGCRLMSTFEDVMQLKEHETNQISYVIFFDIKRNCKINIVYYISKYFLNNNPDLRLT